MTSPAKSSATVTVLGSGTFIPNLKKNASGYLLELADKKIIIDCGSGTLLQLEKLGKELYKELDYIFITHLHPDHTSDLAALMQVLEWFPNSGRKKELVLVGPKGTNDFYDKFLLPIIGPNENKKFKITVQEIKERLSFADFRVETLKAKHPGNCLIYKFSTDQKKLVYSGDTGYVPKMVEFAQDADVLILECTHPSREKNGWDGHLNAEQCAKIAKESNSKQLILSHLPRDEEDNQNKLKIVKKEFPNVALTYDLMEIVL